MIYSVHDPQSGQFAYFEGGPDVAINDDLPTPRWPSDIRTKLGVPSILASRPLPPDARQTGAGALPVGLLSTGMPGVWQGTQKGSIPSGMGLGSDASVGSVVPVLLLGAAAVTFVSARYFGWPLLVIGAGLVAAAIVEQG